MMQICMLFVYALSTMLARYNFSLISGWVVIVSSHFFYVQLRLEKEMGWGSS